MSSNVPNPFPIFVNASGQPINGGYVYIGVAGDNPETNPIPVYSDPQLTVPIAQPIRTIGGYPAVVGGPTRLYVGPVAFSILVRDKQGSSPGVQVFYEPNFVDPIAALQIEIGALDASQITYKNSPAQAVDRTVEARLRERVSLLDFYEATDPDLTSAAQKAASYANGQSGRVGIMVPQGQFPISGAVTPFTQPHCGFYGESTLGSVLQLSYDGPTFTWSAYGGGLENLQIVYPGTPGANAVVAYQNGGDGQNLKNLRVFNIRRMAQMGKADGTAIGNALSVTGVTGNVFNGGSPCFDLYSGAGLLINSTSIYVAGVSNPPVDRTSTMTTVAGTDFIKTNGFGFDTIMVSGGCLLERWWRVLDLVTTTTGGNVLNTFVDNSTVCDYISDDVYHLEAPAGAHAIVNAKLAGYASSWSGRAVNIDATSLIGDVDISELVVPFSGYEGIRIAGSGWRDVRVSRPKLVASNRIAAGNSAGIRAQDSGSGHLSIIEARSGIDGTPSGTPWQATYGISIGPDLNNFTVADSDCQGATGFYDFGTNSSPSGNRRIRDNINADYAGFQTTGVYVLPASTVPWVNTTGFEIEVTVGGGTVTGIQKNARLTGLTAGTLTVLPGDNFTLTYSLAPTVLFYVKP